MLCEVRRVTSNNRFFDAFAIVPSAFTYVLECNASFSSSAEAIGLGFILKRQGRKHPRSGNSYSTTAQSIMQAECKAIPEGIKYITSEGIDSVQILITTLF